MKITEIAKIEKIFSIIFMYLIQIDNSVSFPSVLKHFDRPLNLRLLKRCCNPRDNGSSTGEHRNRSVGR